MIAIPTGHWPGFVACVATPSSPTEITQLVANAWPAVVGIECTHGELLAVASQIMLETGTRQGVEHQAAGFWQGNAGNLRGAYMIAGIACWTSFRAGEGFGVSQVILEPGPMNRFRSYIGANESINDPGIVALAKQRGVRDMVSLLARRYSRALESAQREDFSGYVHELHDKGYFTASESSYSAAEDKLRHTIEHLPQLIAFLRAPLAPEEDRLT